MERETRFELAILCLEGRCFANYATPALLLAKSSLSKPAYLSILWLLFLKQQTQYIQSVADALLPH